MKTKTTKGSSIECLITTTDSGSIKCQVKGDCTPQQASALILKELKNNNYQTLFWPTLYFGIKKKEFTKPIYKSTAKYPTINEVENTSIKSVITDDDVPWIL
jgi:hypothetical protein